MIPPEPPAQVNWHPFAMAALARITNASKTDIIPVDMAAAVRRVREKHKLEYKDFAQLINATPALVYWMEQGRFGKATEAQLLAIGRMAQQLGLMRTASFVYKFALPTIVTAKKRPER